MVLVDARDLSWDMVVIFVGFVPGILLMRLLLYGMHRIEV